MTQERKGRPSTWSPGDDARAYHQEWERRGDVVSGVHRPVDDPRSAGANTSRHFGKGAQLLQGRVVDGVAYVQAYRVFFERNHPAVPCTLGAHTSFLPVGARAANSLLPGTIVWAIVHPGFWHGVIIAVEPAWAVDPTRALSDSFHQASRCGLRVDAAHHAILKLPGGGGAADWSGGRPFDATLAGEWGAITETGLRVLLDSAMVQLGTGEMTAVTAFYHDDLLRVSGYNYQHATCGTEEEVLDDQGEVAIYRGETPYPWEQRGALRPSADPYRELSPQQAQVDAPHYGRIEPVHDDQMAFHRVVRLGGYPGQGGRRMVCLPPPAPPADGLYRYGTPAAPVGVHEEFTTLAGRHVVRSAQGIFLVKQPAIPVPRRAKRPEARSGDAPANYRAAGLPPAGGSASGPAHLVAGAIATSGTRPQLQQAAAVLDTVAYACNWEGVHPFYYHAHDWSLPEESAAAAPVNQYKVPFRTLGTAQYLAAPAAVAVAVDHRYGTVDYYPTTSVLGLLDDGGVVIRGGQGESITLAGGSITLSCPGDVWLKSGRNVNCWAGYDVILRAKNAVDASATKGAVRLKAETDVQVLAGNGGARGAVLIESRAKPGYDYADKQGDDVKAGGIQLKSALGEVAVWAAGVYLRTGGGDVQGGAITLDADRGNRAITTYSRTFDRYLAAQASDYFGTEGQVSAANRFGPGDNALGGGLAIGGPARVTSGGLVVSGDVEVAGGHVYTEQSDEFQGLVGSVGGNALVALQDDLRRGSDAASAAVKDGVKSFADDFAALWYGARRPGNAATIAAAGFSFRAVAQYRTADFALYEDPWQQAARLGDGAPATWTESPVKAGAVQTYPHPGREKWAADATYLEQDLAFFDVAAGAARPRDPALYGHPAFKAPRAVKPDGAYAVIL